VDVTAPVSMALLTEDVSASGLYLRTDSPPGIGTLVDLALHLPDDEPLRIRAVVTQALDLLLARAVQRPPGMGIRFFDLPDDAQHRWGRFMLDAVGMNTHLTGWSEMAMWSRHEGFVEPLRRRAPRFVVEAPVMVQIGDQQGAAVARDLGVAGAYLHGLQLEEGQPLNVGLPAPTGELHWCYGRVARVDEGGVGVSFGTLDFDAVAAREAAMDPLLPPPDMDRLIDLDDPKLA
jgi:hypothetical protein